MEITIIYEDDAILVIDKPSGLVVHPDGKTQEKTLVDWIFKQHPYMKEVGEPLVLSPHDGISADTSTSGEVIERPGIVHRIDRETSGVLVLAKNQNSFLHLKEQFQRREIEKEYRAFVYGEMKEDKGVIAREIGRSSKDFRLWSAQRGARGKLRDARTDYQVLNRGGGFSFVSVFPKTGRTHQIRVHLKAINHPVVCDKLYAPKRECALGFTRLALHAYTLSLTLPSGERKKFTSELPQDFIKAKTTLEESSK